MALRLIEMVLHEKDGADVRDLLKEHSVLEHRQLRLPDGELLVRILLDAEQSEAEMDLLEERYAGAEGNRVVILPVEATLPRAAPEPAATPEQPATEEKSPERISREELYRTSRMPPACRGFIWRWWCCPPSWRPLVCITTAWPSSSGQW
jgi:hypothetical protein